MGTTETDAVLLGVVKGAAGLGLITFVTIFQGATASSRDLQEAWE